MFKPMVRKFKHVHNPMPTTERGERRRHRNRQKGNQMPISKLVIKYARTEE